jgi:hypothetical protein
MSQQHMEFNQPQHADERSASYMTGYQQEQGPYLDEYAADTRGQKLTQQSVSTGPTPGQRLALAIVSLSLFAFAFSVVLIIAFVIPAESLKQLASVLGVFGLLFAILLIVVNVIFNRKQ